jgi:hypothetical protein
MAISLSNIALEIHEEMGTPSSPSKEQISSWLEYNVGKLNNKISTFYTFVSGDFSPQINTDEKAVLKALYYHYFYKNKARTSLLGIESNNILSLRDDQSSVQFTNPKDVAKVYREISDDYWREANELANLYKHNRSGPRDPQDSWTGHWV